MLIQSFSDIITNSSSEVFLIQGHSKEEVEALQEQYADLWRCSGCAGEFSVLTFLEDFEDLISEDSWDNQYIICEWDKESREWIIPEKFITNFGEYIDYKNLCIDLRELTSDQYIDLVNLDWGDNVTLDDLRVDVDNANHEFIDDLIKTFKAIRI